MCSCLAVQHTQKLLEPARQATLMHRYMFASVTGLCVLMFYLSGCVVSCVVLCCVVLCCVSLFVCVQACMFLPRADGALAALYVLDASGVLGLHRIVAHSPVAGGTSLRCSTSQVVVLGCLFVCYITCAHSVHCVCLLFVTLSMLSLLSI